MNKLIINKSLFDEIYKKSYEEVKIYFEQRAMIYSMMGGENSGNFDDFLNAVNALIPYTLITYITIISMDERIRNSVNKDRGSYMLMSYFMNMLTSHTYIIRDFEFYNVALINKYFLEAISGIVQHKQNLDDFFMEMNYDEYEKRLGKKNKSFKKTIEETMGEEFGEIYKYLNAFSHPSYGPIYGINMWTQSTRDITLLSWIMYSYEVGIKKVFEILGFEIDLSQLDEIYKMNSEMEMIINKLKNENSST